ncbi:MAG: hypothetical protein AAGA97_00465 [Pseudomonadota bacterium]
MATILLIFMAFYPQAGNAETTTADFLEWDERAQASFFEISISMAGIIAAQTQPEIAECLNDWYYAEGNLPSKRHAEMIELMPQYAEHDPTVVVLAYIEGVCGEFDEPS